MTNIKKFKSFLENYNQYFFSPEEPTTITDREEIVEILRRLDNQQIPFFDKNPKHQNKQGEPMRIITQSEIDRFVEYRMRNPLRRTGKIGKKIGIPDALDFYGRKDSELLSIVQMTRCWFSMIENDYEDFILGKSSFQIDGVWFAHENILNKEFPWSVEYGIEEIGS